MWGFGVGGRGLGVCGAVGSGGSVAVDYGEGFECVAWAGGWGRRGWVLGWTRELMGGGVGGEVGVMVRGGGGVDWAYG